MRNSPGSGSPTINTIERLDLSPVLSETRAEAELHSEALSFDPFGMDRTDNDDLIEWYENGSDADQAV